MRSGRRGSPHGASGTGDRRSRNPRPPGQPSPRPPGAPEPQVGRGGSHGDQFQRHRQARLREDEEQEAGGEPRGWGGPGRSPGGGVGGAGVPAGPASRTCGLEASGRRPPRMCRPRPRPSPPGRRPSSRVSGGRRRAGGSPAIVEVAARPAAAGAAGAAVPETHLVLPLAARGAPPPRFPVSPLPSPGLFSFKSLVSPSCPGLSVCGPLCIYLSYCFHC